MFQEKTQPVNLIAPIANGAKDIPMVIAPEAMGKIMSKLIDLYKDPIQATVREIVSNALDATDMLLREGSSVNPVEIHSPSQMNPYFIVRDYGIGMSPEIIEKVFSRYGVSTKEKDDNQTGAFGLGAKAPLSYVDEFFFETTRDGYTSKVSVSRNDAGPLTRILEVVKTDQPSGTVVTVPVPSYGYSTREKFEEVIEHYRNYAFTMGQSISVDGTVQSSNSDYHFYDEIIFNEESQRKGKVWVNTESLRELLLNMKRNVIVTSSDLYKNVDYVLSGFVYASPYSKRVRYGKSLFLIELPPKILNFSPSRDDIINDEMYEAFEEEVFRQLLSKEAFYQSVLSYYRSLGKKEAYSLLSDMVLTKPENSSEFSFSYSRAAYDTILPKNTVVKVDEFTTHEGYNPLIEDEEYKNKSPFLGRVTKKDSSALSFFDFYRADYDSKHKNKKFISFEESISDVKERLMKNIDREDSSHGFVKAALMMPVKKSKVIDHRESAVVVSVNSDKEISLVLRNRKHIPDSDHIFFVKGEIKDNLKNLVFSRMEAVSNNISVRYISVDEIKQKAAEVRALQKVTSEKSSSFSFVEYEGTVNSQRDIFNYSFKVRNSKQAYHVDELISLNPIIFITPSSDYGYSRKSILNGLYEKEGAKIFNRTVLEIKSPTKGFYEGIKSNPEMLMTNSEYKTKSALEKEILAQRRFNRSINSDIAILTPLELSKKAILVQHIVGIGSFNTLSTIMNYADSESVNRNVQKFSKWAAENTRVNIDRIAESISEILSYNTPYDESFGRVYMEDLGKTFSKDSLIFVEFCAMIVREVNSPGSNHSYGKSSCEKEMSALISTHSVTKSEYVQSVIADRVNEIIGEVIG